MNRRGGKRVGAGRKTKYSYLIKLAIQLRVAELKKEKPRLSDNAAIKALQARGELPEGSFKNLARYLTPDQIGGDSHRVLGKAPKRAGIIALIPESIKIEK
jgi:hypothetical protein